MLVSIIIPIYNVEAYLRECLNSVIKQTYGNWECILIDDASTDASGAIAREFCAADTRFRLISHSENQGLSRTRNSGLDAARGEYVTFIDSDDYISADFLKTAMAEPVDAEIICLSFAGEKSRPGIYDAPEALARMLYQNSGINSSFCGKVFDVKLFDSLRFTPGRTYEDLDLIDRVVCRASRVKVINHTGYFYRQRPGSILHTWNVKRLDVLKVTEEIESRLKDDSMLAGAARARRFAANFNIFLLLRKNGAEKSAEAESCRVQLRRLRRQVLTDSRARLKDRVGALIAFFV
ncbi:MAG: glycosyltransferase family 2 protein [Bacteroides sp.]|nr:glycosyltransferase family 2 protein [Bacteroides sp.]